jgi:hypothetical protein
VHESSKPERTPGVILSDACYAKEEFLARTGFKQAAWRSARRNGLRVVETGGRAFVLGSDWIAYLSSIARDGA